MELYVKMTDKEYLDYLKYIDGKDNVMPTDKISYNEVCDSLEKILESKILEHTISKGFNPKCMGETEKELYYGFIGDYYLRIERDKVL